jgi:DNA polymerase V
MGDIARCSVGQPGQYYNEELLYRIFGINAELLIDHAWGWEPCTIADIKAYKPQSSSFSSGQVLMRPYKNAEAAVIVREMTDSMVLDLVDKGLVTDQMVLSVGYDIDNLRDPEKLKKYKGEVVFDHYGRATPKGAHGSINLGRRTSSTRLIMDAVTRLFERIADPALTVRRLCVAANNVVPESAETPAEKPEQLDFFTDYDQLERQRRLENEALCRERSIQKALIGIKKRYGKNAVLKGMNFKEGATAIERNAQIGGHKA